MFTGRFGGRRIWKKILAIQVIFGFTVGAVVGLTATVYGFFDTFYYAEKIPGIYPYMINSLPYHPPYRFMALLSCYPIQSWMPFLIKPERVLLRIRIL